MSEDGSASSASKEVVSGVLQGIGFAVGWVVAHVVLHRMRVPQPADNPSIIPAAGAPRKGSFPRSRNATLLARREPPRPPPRRKPG